MLVFLLNSIGGKNTMNIKKFVDEKLRKADGRLCQGRMKGNWIEKHYPKEFEEINKMLSRLGETDGLYEGLYVLYNDIEVIPDEDFVCWKHGYSNKYKSKLSKIDQFLERNKRRNSHLWENGLTENADYVVCPVTGTRLSMIKRNYVEKVLEMDYDKFLETYPEQKLVCDIRYENIRNGLKVIDEETGMTKHEKSNKKRYDALSKVGPDGMTGFRRYTRKTRETHLNKIDENGLNGYQRIAVGRNETILENGLSVQRNGLLKGLKKQEDGGRISRNRHTNIYKAYTRLVRSLSNSRKIKRKGFEVDHIYPVSKGFDNNISPLILMDDKNLQLLTKSENTKKHAKITMTLDELFKMVNKTKEQNDIEFNVFLEVYDKEPITLKIYEKMVGRLNELCKK